MTGRKTTSFRFSIGSFAHLVLLTALAIPATLLAQEPDHQHGSGQSPASSELVMVVRKATVQFIDVNNATAAGYGPFLGCVSGPDHGAMGIHYVNGTLVGDGQLDPYHPEALIYEPSHGKLRLVGVEFIVDAATWLANHDNTPPVLDGQTFQFVDSPNRFNLNPFFELHVWAWRDNPQGAFVDWNNHVSCEGQ
ncbi:MAG TPA: hypothetical protein VMU05_18110 [Dongiaceae bacterium]|nr:hypothetical protein [Dongiaceae bacterium]